jgi:heme A synthase
VRPLRLLVPAAAAMALVLAGLGSWVRINNASLSCPQWPLCRGTSLAGLSGGAFLEMTHRTAAGAEGLLFIAIVVAGWPLRTRIAGLAPLLVALLGLFGIETALGAAVVLSAASPLSVTAHWVCAVSVLAALAALAIVTNGSQQAEGSTAWKQLAVAATLAFAAMCLGSLLASLSPGMERGAAGAVGLLHRLVAGSFIVVATLAATATLQRGSAHAKSAVKIGLSLALCQAALGIAVVRLGLPPLLKEAHAANAALTFLAFVAAATFAAREPARAPGPPQSRPHTAAPEPA